MNINQKGSTKIALIVLVVILVGALGYVTLVKEPDSTGQPQTNNLQDSPVDILQLTTDSVLNGYNQCDQQFKNGTFDFPGTYQEYQKWELARGKEGKISCFLSNILSTDKIVFADLDDDGIVEALVPGRVVYASSGGVLYVFKNIDGVARVVDMAVFGKVNGEVVSVNKNTIVVQTDEWMQYSPEKQTYKFIDDKLIKQ